MTAVIRYVLAAVILALAVFGGTQWYQVQRLRVQLAEEQTRATNLSRTRETAIRQAVERARDADRQLLEAQAVTLARSNDELLAARVGLARAGDSTDRLQRELASARRAARSRECSPSPAAAASAAPAASTADDLSAYVSRRISEAAAGISGFAEESYVAAAGCTANYNAAREQQQSQSGRGAIDGRPR